jgi:hypothetical protein
MTRILRLEAQHIRRGHKEPNMSSYVHCPKLKLRGQYRTHTGTITTYIHVLEGEFQYNNVLHPKQSLGAGAVVNMHCQVESKTLILSAP